MFTGIQFILALAILITGIQLTTSVSMNSVFFIELEALSLGYFLGYLFVVIYFGAVSIVFYFKREFSNRRHALFGVAIFFFGVLPIMIT